MTRASAYDNQQSI